MRRLLACAFAFAVCWVLAAIPVAAAPGDVERSTVEDHNDVLGLMDVAEARYVHESGQPPDWHVRTYGTWRPIEIWDRGFIWIELDTRYGDAADFSVLLRADRSRMVGTLFRITPDAGSPDVRVADVTIWRRSADSVSVTLPLKALVFGEARTTFRWWVVASFVGDACPATCVDDVPDDPAFAASEDAPGGPPASVTARG